VEAKTGKKLAKSLRKAKLDSRFQIEHAERIGLGSTDYKLIELDY